MLKYFLSLTKNQVILKMKKILFTLSLGALSLSAFSQASTVWQPYNSNLDTSSYVRYLSVVDTNTVWGVGFLTGRTNTNWFTRTIDGTNFNKGLIFPDTLKYNVSNISAIDANTAYVSAYFIAATGTSGRIMKTFNGGSTWTVASDTTTMFKGTSNFPDWVHFWNANNGIALGDPNGNTGGGAMAMFEIWRTYNGGTSWTRVADANVPAPLSGEFGLTNSYTTWKGHIWSGTSDGARVYASADSGKTWTVNIGTIGLAGGIIGLAFRDSLHGLLWGAASTTATISTVMKTTDGGATWSTVTTNSTVGTSYISTIPKTTVYMSVGLNGTGAGYVTSVSYNDAASWTVLETGITNPVRMLSVQMLDSLHGWAGNYSTNTLPYGTNGINKYKGPKIAGIKSLVEVDNSLVYPNPSNGYVHIFLPKAIAGTEISVHDMIGNKVYKTTLDRTIINQDINVDISNMQKGIYMLTITNGESKHNEKIIIQ